MFQLPFARKAFTCWLLAAALSGVASGQTNFVPNGGEYAIAGLLLGDQVHPQLSLGPSGGFLVWEDNTTDGSGLGISALQLDGGLSAYYSPFRVNVTAAYDQERPQVALLKNGGAVFVWQGGRQGFQHIYARFLGANGMWLSTNDVPVNTFTNSFQNNPAVATLANSNVVVVWASYNQFSSTSMQDVYGQILSPTGQKIGGEFLINQFAAFNQRTPAVAPLNDGGFVVAWVSEQERVLAPTPSDPADTNWSFAFTTSSRPSVDVYMRLYGTTNYAALGTNEVLVNTDLLPCANPSIAVAADGGFLVAWSQKDLVTTTNSWDVFTRPVSSAGARGTVRRINTMLYGDQYAPSVAALGSDFLMVWTSLGQDGSWEGVYGRFLNEDGSPSSKEFPVNTTWVNRQIHPVVAANSAGQFLVAWSGFTVDSVSFDLFGQRYLKVGQPLQPMSAPFVHVPFVVSNGVYQPQLQVSWPNQMGILIDHYDVYVDGAASPTVSLTANLWLMTAANGLVPSSTHSFRIGYVVPDGRHSPLSPAASGTTWSSDTFCDTSGDCLPAQWVSQYYRYGSLWPAPDAPLAPGGPTLYQVFLTGANPRDPSTWLRVSIAHTWQGYFLNWNPQPGLTYQVQSSSNLETWTNLGGPRFAAGNQDSVFLGLNNAGYYRVLWLH